MVTSSGIFENVVFSIEFPNNYSYKQKKRLKQAVAEQGGSLSFFLNKKCRCHLMEENTPVTSKASKSLRLNIPVLKFSFILDAIKNGRLPNDTSFYEIFGPSSQLRGGKICASTQTSPTNILQHKLRLFRRANSCAVDDAKFKGSVRIPEERVSILKWIAFKGKDVTLLELQQCQPVIGEVTDTKSRNEPRSYQIQLSSSNSKNASEAERFWSTDSLEEAADVYAKIGTRLEAKKATALSPADFRRELLQLKQSDMGSLSFQRLIGRAEISTAISLTVLQLIEWLWTEAVSFVNSVAPISSFANLKQNKLDEAESLLHSAKALLVNIDIDDDRAEEQANKLSEMSAKINECFSLKSGTILLRSLKVVCRLLDFCQVIRDLISVGEVTNWQRQPTPQAMLNAIHCEIGEVAKESETFSALEMHLKKDLPKLDVKAVFAVKRPLEAAEFSRVSNDISNHQQLYHGSKVENIIGILFRGLIMPKEVETAFGIQRTDEGHLGSGIYFSDCFTTTAKYCSAGSSVRLRVATINDVALGNVFETKQHMVGINSPPESFQSVHGVKHSSENASQFKDDEFAIYYKSQQTLRFLVVFALPEDNVGSAAFYKLLQQPQLSISPAAPDLINVSNISSNETLPVTELDLTKPDSPQKSGLICGGDSIPLKELHVRANIVDLVSEVVIYQAYENPYDRMVEVKYVFPLDDNAAVCGFEAFINGKHVIGRVEEKQAARMEYKEAVEKGHGAYLMEIEKRDIFTISIGNLPPKCTVIIKLTYIAELCYESDGSLLFNLPASIANWDRDTALANSEGTQNQTESVTATALGLKTSLTASIQMPQTIKQIRSPSHSIKVKKTETKAVVELSADSRLDRNFSLLISMAEVNVPRMWVEEDPIDGSEACMLVFYPEFEAGEDPLPEITILLDMSNSMQGAASESAKLVALGLLRCCVVEFGENCLLNVACFGSYYHECFTSSQRPSESTIERLRKYIQVAIPNMGDTDIFSAVEACSAKPHELLRNLCIITDGHAHNESETFELCRRFKNQLRLFSLGISETANGHFLKTLARTSGGACEMFQESMKYKWAYKLKQQVRKLAEPCVSDVRIQWKNHDDDHQAENHNLTKSGGLCSQAPAVISSVFSHERLIVYGMIPHCLEATLWVTVDGKELSTSVFTNDLAKTYGQTLHKLTANAIISDWSSGTLHTEKINHEVKKREYQSEVVELSKRYSVVCPLTSFVAVEEREKDETFVGVSILPALLEAHTNDILSYLSWPETPITAEGQTEAPTHTKTVPIVVKTLTGKSISFETFPSESVKSIKQKILESEGIPLGQQRLIFAGRQLDDNCSLADYDMKTDKANELHLVLRLRGSDTKDMDAHSKESNIEPLAKKAAGRKQKKLLSIQSSDDDAEFEAETSLPNVLDQTCDESALRWVFDVLQEHCEISDSAEARDKRDQLVARCLVPCGLYGGSFSDHVEAPAENKMHPETPTQQHEVNDLLPLDDCFGCSAELLEDDDYAAPETYEPKDKPRDEQAVDEGPLKRLISVQSSDADCLYVEDETSLPTVVDEMSARDARRLVWDVVREQVEASDSAEARDKHDQLWARNFRGCGLYASDRVEAAVENKMPPPEIPTQEHEVNDLMLLGDSIGSPLAMPAMYDYAAQENDESPKSPTGERYFQPAAKQMIPSSAVQFCMTGVASVAQIASGKEDDSAMRSSSPESPPYHPASRGLSPESRGYSPASPDIPEIEASITKSKTTATQSAFDSAKSERASVRPARRTGKAVVSAASDTNKPISSDEDEFDLALESSVAAADDGQPRERSSEAGKTSANQSMSDQSNVSPSRRFHEEEDCRRRAPFQDASPREARLYYRRADIKQDNDWMTSSNAAASNRTSIAALSQRSGLTSDDHQAALESASSVSFGSAPEVLSSGSNVSAPGALFGAPPLQPTFGSNVSAFSGGLFGAPAPPQTTFGSSAFAVSAPFSAPPPPPLFGSNVSTSSGGIFGAPPQSLSMFALGAPFKAPPPPPPQLFGSNVSAGSSLFGCPPSRPMTHAFMQQQQHASVATFGGFGSTTVMAAGQFQALTANDHPPAGVAAFGLSPPPAQSGASWNVSDCRKVFLRARQQPQTATLSNVPFAALDGFGPSKTSSGGLIAPAAATVCPAPGRGGLTFAAASFGFSSNDSQTSSLFGRSPQTIQPTGRILKANTNMGEPGYEASIEPTKREFASAPCGMTPTTASIFGPPTSLDVAPSSYPFAPVHWETGQASTSLFGPPASSKQSTAETFQFPRGKDLQSHLFGSPAQQPGPRGRFVPLAGNFGEMKAIIPPPKEHPARSMPASEGEPTEKAIDSKKLSMLSLSVDEVIQMFHQTNEESLANQQLRPDATDFFQKLWGILAERGLTSLGSRVQSEMKTMWKIIVAVFILNLHTNVGVGVGLQATSIELGLTSQDVAKSLHLDVEWIEQQFKAVWRNAILPNVSEFGYDKPSIKQTVRAAKASCIELFKKHSLLCYELELGRNIREMIYTLFGGSA